MGGLPEVITDGVDGYYCAVGDVDTMAARAIEVLSDDSKLATMGKARGVRRRIASAPLDHSEI